MTDTPDFDKMSPKEMMKWMESLAVRQGVTAVPSAPSVGDRVRRFIFKDVPSWMRGGTPAATVAPVTAPVAPAATEVVDFDTEFNADMDDDLFDDLDAEFDDFDDSMKK